MKLRIKPFNDKAKALYENHSHFHSGDAGLDLFVVDDQVIPGNSTQPIHLQVACENLDNKAYYLFPRSSISKTPIRLANSIGLIDGEGGTYHCRIDNFTNKNIVEGSVIESYVNQNELSYHIHLGLPIIKNSRMKIA
ncbi:hypothetical protein OAO84_01605, partial [Candidatus Marinimicrobia bacterium]|nr:hypothetical protein [Candidatus Neomarinimicrobiota bacterium]